MRLENPWSDSSVEAQACPTSKKRGLMFVATLRKTKMTTTSCAARYTKFCFLIGSVVVQRQRYALPCCSIGVIFIVRWKNAFFWVCPDLKEGKRSDIQLNLIIWKPKASTLWIQNPTSRNRLLLKEFITIWLQLCSEWVFLVGWSIPYHYFMSTVVPIPRHSAKTPPVPTRTTNVAQSRPHQI